MVAQGPLKVTFPERGVSVAAERGDNLLALIREAGLPLDADCGGTGRCGKCRALLNGEPCLACTAYITGDSEVRIPFAPAERAARAGEGYAILDDWVPTAGADAEAALGAAAGVAPDAAARPSSGGCALAIDIGTTTVAARLVDRASGREAGSFALLNAQTAYGADVLSRIEASLDDSSVLSALITAQLDTAVAALLKERRIAREQVEKVVIAANTAMSYILLGLPCRSLGLAPFEPAFPPGGPYPYPEVFGSDTLACDCDVLPFISAYVGGDLVAGLCALHGEDDFVLMDMGTNGELLFKRGERLLCTATAAGPAFEGGSIECGSGSVQGAVSSVSCEGGGFRLKTIGAAPPISICGSGILDLMAVLLREGLVDRTGLLSERVADGRVVLWEGTGPAAEESGAERHGAEGEVSFTQKDVRQFQLAKGAVRAGLAVLIEEMGAGPPSQVFLAGGFGQALDPGSAVAVGLLPREFEGRVHAIGNSSLGGAVKVCLNDTVRSEVVSSIAHAQEVNLATHRRFNDLFMEHMLF
ncbi:MAG: ASKHA domain-containing protein [Coriobacteriales bacterium]|jgi:uncharacterized 2Fe-2S/4Fe-4S cluster protein (DUF4445 family)|nr:ASKHA domain-containing protein [Coriobacteriales bacterium]